MRDKLLEHCPKCHQEVEKENEELRAEEEQQKQEEQRMEEMKKEKNYVCIICGDYHYEEESYIGRGLRKSFSNCPRCGRSVCSICTSYTDMYGDVVCKICYEDLLNEKAEEWDREYKDECDWPNSYRVEED